MFLLNYTLLFCRISTGVNSRHILPVNWNVSKWQDIIDLTKIEFQEPAATAQHLSDEKFFSLTQENSWCKIPDLLSHSQIVEQSVKLVSDALCIVYG